jgi:hypothetical protein
VRNPDEFDADLRKPPNSAAWSPICDYRDEHGSSRRLEPVTTPQLASGLLGVATRR